MSPAAVTPQPDRLVDPPPSSSRCFPTTLTPKRGWTKQIIQNHSVRYALLSRSQGGPSSFQWGLLTWHSSLFSVTCAQKNGNWKKKALLYHTPSFQELQVFSIIAPRRGIEVNKLWLGMQASHSKRGKRSLKFSAKAYPKPGVQFTSDDKT